jgi:glycosyltransferase involved in cell wall biosynthesis
VPSLSEGTPLVVLEAMTAGVPLVATPVGGIPEQVQHGRDALLVPPADPCALADAVVDLLKNRNRAQHLADAARCRVAVCASHQAMIEQTLAIYAASLVDGER